MSDLSKFKIQSAVESRSFTGQRGEQVPVKEMVATLPGGVGPVLISIMGRDCEKVPASWEIAQIVEVRDGMTLEAAGEVRGGEHKGMPQYRLKWPRVGGGARTGGGWASRTPATDIDPDSYLGLALTFYRGFHDGLKEIIDPRAYGEIASVAGTMTNAMLIAMNLHPMLAKKQPGGVLIPPPQQEEAPF